MFLQKRPDLKPYDKHRKINGAEAVERREDVKTQADVLECLLTVIQTNNVNVTITKEKEENPSTLVHLFLPPGSVMRAIIIMTCEQ